jgi:hypothetical protein
LLTYWFCWKCRLDRIPAYASNRPNAGY